MMPSNDDSRDASEQPLILCYHAISSSWKSQLAVPSELLREHLAILRSRGYVGLTFAEAERRRREGTLPARSVVVTFDDGYASTLLAKEALDEVGFPATVFVVTSFIESGEPLRWPGIEMWLASDSRHELRPLNWRDLEGLAGAGWEIGSHTTTHPLLSAVGDGVIERELVDSRAAIVARLGSCDSLAYPYGIADDRVPLAARATGYAGACTLSFVHRFDEEYRRPRIGLSASDTSMRFKLQISRGGRRLRRSGVAGALRRLQRHRRWLPPEAGEVT
jgi:peptidoglycan/xylan/chitin deacetylase (PgdA/CDA1 family)